MEYGLGVFGSTDGIASTNAHTYEILQRFTVSGLLQTVVQLAPAAGIVFAYVEASMHAQMGGTVTTGWSLPL